MLYIEDRKNLKVYAVLENVVELDTGNLHGYRVVSRVLYGDEEVSFTEIANRDLKMKIEIAVNRLGAQLGHGFMFGYEQIKAHI